MRLWACQLLQKIRRHGETAIQNLSGTARYWTGNKTGWGTAGQFPCGKRNVQTCPSVSCFDPAINERSNRSSGWWKRRSYIINTEQWVQMSQHTSVAYFDSYRLSVVNTSQRQEWIFMHCRVYTFFFFSAFQSTGQMYTFYSGCGY